MSKELGAPETCLPNSSASWLRILWNSENTRTIMEKVIQVCELAVAGEQRSSGSEGGVGVGRRDGNSVPGSETE